MIDHRLRSVIRTALKEDLGGRGDVTTLSAISEGIQATGKILCKGEGILAGIGTAEAVFHEVDPGLEFVREKSDGQRVERGEVVATIKGEVRSLLVAERTTLNFLQHLSGIATLTHKYVEAVSGLPVRIVDTRKTLPGLRELEKYAVRCGGGYNHRFGLYDGVLLKDNHLKVCGSIREAVEKARSNSPHLMKVEVEVETLDQLRETLEAGADVIMLDNLSVEEMRKAVEIAGDRCLLEASGSIRLENVREVAETGVDIISIGAITMSAPALDFSLELFDVIRGNLIDF
ncbi:carboxylating nicotinate-nucleotide pyrophosphorylase [Candidatus Hakubella thermalkaliphila]|uniref:Nicotinate-nucleotide pyrophosphorylase [carboxylating] n=1 Tax=Candidatus Hakubella thermalkaliphila TaxID=2754717 RepID=A0A6V8Q7A7_9ACTN|nr:carboxylating nicotinate-nucleotide diphosphorylase [Candidatus Hakubella thermalkaliphila]MBT9170195.1 putative nicotinate-nucleotide pyrophosphorylase (carboxylating) [Actinomycetota bacterium]GFP19084.1 carboxylating nicotinate-nucleotide pyrophosphorylase [Candidatus Hakubella thermalkaliphila]GFP23024.1 carboxylating nicotinate-nucleotide pyrophosphorylase [Candidatus Hakubella thermalkaliphila]GFP39266.1 carboxylating nicotinate-nucleotide pyrophosphorylase [Candidatus Hakubella therma